MRSYEPADDIEHVAPDGKRHAPTTKHDRLYAPACLGVFTVPGNRLECTFFSLVALTFVLWPLTDPDIAFCLPILSAGHARSTPQWSLKMTVALWEWIRSLQCITTSGVESGLVNESLGMVCMLVDTFGYTLHIELLALGFPARWIPSWGR